MIWRNLLSFALGLVLLSWNGCWANIFEYAPEVGNTSNIPVILNVPTWNVRFPYKQLNTTMTQIETVPVIIYNIDKAWGDSFEFHIRATNEELIKVEHIVYPKDVVEGDTFWRGNLSVEALFLGKTDIYVELVRLNMEPEIGQEHLTVVIMRNETAWDTIFKICVASFVMILYINFGAVLEMDALKAILLRPIGPAIGFIGQFIVMPILSFLIGYLLFRDMIELRLGLFFTGSTPGGGASNIFTVILSGNLNLSITMTAISNLAAFGMMPLWIFTLGALIFKDGNFSIPYKAIATMSFSLVAPLCVGILLQRYAPNFAKRMSKLLKPISLILVVFITIFAFTVNFFMFKLFSWKILLASSALPWIGYCIGWILAIICKQNSRDALTIAIETGIQNTGIAIFMLNFTLPQPQADMTSAVPVANSMMTPLPLLIIFIFQKIFKRKSIEEVEEAPTKIQKDIEIEKIMTKAVTNDSPNANKTVSNTSTS